MNHSYRSIRNEKTGTCVAVSEIAGTGRRSSTGAGTSVRGAPFAVKALAVSLMMSFAASGYAGPAGGVVAAGAAGIAVSGARTTITQSTQNVAINWQSFGIAAGEAVQFVQPNSSSVALNRVLGPDASAIFGSLSANGKVFLVNPNGILFGSGASVNVGGLVASTLNISDANFMAGRYSFTDPGNGSVLNEGTINADGGYVALLGTNVGNQGAISARLGTVALAAGNAITLDLVGDNLLNVTVDQGAVKALVQNGGIIQADGGQVLLTAQAAAGLLSTVVNNTGVIQARTISSHKGTIKLLGDMQGGTLNLSGTLDASAPNGGDGGFIETSATNVKIANDARVTTAAAQGSTGSWLIDPVDFTIEAGHDISGATLSAALVTNNITIHTATGTNTANDKFGTVGTNGDIFVNEPISWTAVPGTSPTTLTLIAFRDVIVRLGAPITAVDGNLVVCCGRDIRVNDAISTTRGSILLSAGRDLYSSAAITTTNGNITMCAARDVNISAAITLTNGTSDPNRSLGLERGLVLSAGTGGTGPGVAGGTVILTGPPNSITVTGADATDAPVHIYYNPTSYTTPTDYLGTGKFALSIPGTLFQHMLVFADVADRTFDGTTTAYLSSSLKGNPAGVTLVGGPGSSADYDSAADGIDKVITYSGYTLSGVNAADYALAVSCCGPIVARTTGTILPASPKPPPPPPPPRPEVVPPPDVVPPPPVVVPPVVVPPVVVPPVVVPPVVVPPVVVPPVVVPPVVVPPVVVTPPVVVVTPPVVVVTPPVVVVPVAPPPAPEAYVVPPLVSLALVPIVVEWPVTPRVVPTAPIPVALVEVPRVIPEVVAPAVPITVVTPVTPVAPAPVVPPRRAAKPYRN